MKTNFGWKLPLLCWQRRSALGGEGCVFRSGWEALTLPKDQLASEGLLSSHQEDGLWAAAQE